MEFKRVTLFAGHYGSGKTNIAVNYALALKKSGKDTTIADLDIVNPYFRAKDSKDILEENGIKFISSEFANSNVDFPALPSETYGIVMRRDTYAVIDVGGDDRGALALGRYVPYILEENDYEMLFVANCFRPLTRTADDALTVMREIETACGIKFTGIINNSNLGRETTADDILSSMGFIKELSEKSGLKIKFTSVDENLGNIDNIGEVFKMKLAERYYDIKESKNG